MVLGRVSTAAEFDPPILLSESQRDPVLTDGESGIFQNTYGKEGGKGRYNTVAVHSSSQLSYIQRQNEQTM